MDDATYQDESGTATFTKAETDQVTRVLSGVGLTFRKIDSNKLSAFLNLQNSLTGKMLGASVKTYINAKVRTQTKIDRSHAAGYLQFVADKFDAEIGKLKTEKSRSELEQRKNETLILLKSHQDLLGNIFAFMAGIVEAKDMIISKLNRVKNIGTFIRTSNGFKVTTPEGYVAIDRVGGNAVKLVDRMEFSFNNFTAIKAWDR
jgi:hypothetical protein